MREEICLTVQGSVLIGQDMRRIHGQRDLRIAPYVREYQNLCMKHRPFDRY